MAQRLGRFWEGVFTAEDKSRCRFLLEIFATDVPFSFRCLRPEFIEALASDEFSFALERCCRGNAHEDNLEANNARSGVDPCEQLLYWFIKIDEALVEQNELGNDRATAMLHHYRRCLLTSSPDNLERLLRVVLVLQNNVDVDGAALCKAVDLLVLLSNYVIAFPELLDKKLTLDGKTKPFTYHLLLTCVKYLQREPNRNHNDCACIDKVLQLLLQCFAFCCPQEPPHDMLQDLASVDWVPILQFPFIACKCCGGPHGASLFTCLMKIPCRVLEQDPDSDAAWDMLGDLGVSGCLLFMKLWGQIASRKFFWLREGWRPRSASEGANSLTKIVNFVLSYTVVSPLLFAPQVERNGTLEETIRRAHTVLVENRSSMAQWAEESTMHSYDQFISYTEDLWPIHRLRTPEDRWNGFRRNIQPLVNIRPEVRERIAHERRSKIGDAEYCVNCFRLQEEAGSKLSKCSRCELVKYCRRDCQRKHWKKWHKAKCRPKNF